MSTSLDERNPGVQCHVHVDMEGSQTVFRARVQWELEGRMQVETAEHMDLDAALDWINHTLRQQVTT